MRKVYGVAINDADYAVDPCIKVNGKVVHTNPCPYYRRWLCILGRCFSKQAAKLQPSYAGNSVCEEWLIFSNFKKWMEKQDWKGNVLDKDLLVYGNSIYSPETCVFIPAWLNNLFLDAKAKRGELPLGVHFQKYNDTNKYNYSISKPYIASIRKDNKLYHLGSFETKESAHLAWQKEKLKYVEEKCKIFIGQDLYYKGILPRINRLKEDIINNRITVNLHHNRGGER